MAEGRERGSERQRTCLALLALVGLIGLASPAVAQQSVGGVVLDRSTRQGIEGAMVVLLSGDQVVARALSAADGSFSLRAPGPGVHTLRVDRLGYASTFGDPFDVPLAGTVYRTVEAEVRAVALRGLDVTGAERCQLRPADGATTARVWEEVRKALEAAQWTTERELYRFTWTRFVRELDARERVTGEEREQKRVFTPQPFVSVHPDTLAVQGFVRERDGDLLHAAPDAAVLLSDAFLDGHCFRVERRVDGERTLLGLRFEPVRGRRLPDVKGVLWLDERSGLLESLDYEYVNLDRRAAVNGNDASGALRFRALPNGTWIVEEWSIRMPRLVEVRDPDGRPRRYDIRGYVEEGGTISRIASRSGDVLAATAGVIEGEVTDSLGVPVDGGRVWIPGSGLEATTDEAGRFRIETSGAGRWEVRATHAGLARFGHAGSVAEVETARDEVRFVRLGLPSLTAVALGRCASDDAGQVALAGTVVRPDGTPAAGAEVRIGWTEARSALTSRHAGVGTAADTLGTFVVCALPPDRRVLVAATLGSELAASASVALPEGVRPVASIALRLDDDRRDRSMDRLFADAPDVSEERRWVASTGFDLRADRAMLHLTRTQISQLSVDSLPQLLVRAPNVEVRPRQNEVTEYRLHPDAGWARTDAVDSSCEIDFYLNGSLVFDRMEAVVGLGLHELLKPRDLSGLELYDGESSPVGPTDACGALLLWVDAARHRDDPDFTGNVFGRVGDDDAVVPGTTVRLSPGGFEAEIDARGFFDFGPLPPALYLLEAVLPEWGSWSTAIDVRAGTSVEVVVGPESDDGAGSAAVGRTPAEPEGFTGGVDLPMDPTAFRAEYCPDGHPHAAILTGRVLEAELGTGVPGARVDVRWSFSPGIMDWDGVPQDFDGLVRVTTGASGSYLACDVPAPSRAVVRVTVDGRIVTEASLAVSRDEVVVRDLTIGR